MLVSGKKSALPALVSSMETALTALHSWFRANSLKVNANKTQIIVFGNRQNLQNLPLGEVTVTFRGVSLQPSTEVKNLGIVFDSRLSWDQHISLLTRRCFGMPIGLVHLRHYLPETVLSTLVSALVLSHVRYCLTVYGNGTAKNMDRIQKILNFSARVISGRKKYEHISDVQRELGWLSAPDLVRCHTLMSAHRVLINGEPEGLADQYCRCREVRHRRTRQDDALRAPRCRTACGQRRFAYRSVHMYNALRTSLTDRPVRFFGRALRRHLAERSRE